VCQQQQEKEYQPDDDIGEAIPIGLEGLERRDGIEPIQQGPEYLHYALME